MDRLRRIFLTGLVVLVPVALSIWILFRITIFLENILGPLFKNVLRESYVPGIGIAALILAILLVGYVASNLIGKRLLRYFNRLVEKVPLFNKVYLTIKGISDSIFGEDRKKFFEGVVLVPFPKEGVQTIGFVTAVPKELGPDQVGVFVPTPPNIANGFYLIYPKKDVKFLDMPVEEGIKLVLSIGMVARTKKENGADKSG